jgi:Zinc-binding dehydrogenase
VCRNSARILGVSVTSEQFPRNFDAVLGQSSKPTVVRSDWDGTSLSLDHNDCGITCLAHSPELLARHFGVAPADLGALAIADPYKAVAVDVAALKANPQLPGGFLVTGLVYDVTIGQPGGGPDVLIECQCGGSYRERNRACLRTVCKGDSSTVLRIVSDSKIWFDSRIFHTYVETVFPLARASEALQLSESRRVSGKIVL